MTGADVAALTAGIGVLIMSFAVFQIVGQELMARRMRLFVKRGQVVQQQVSLRKKAKVSRVALVEDWNRKLRQANYGKKLQLELIRAGLDMQASRFVVIQLIVALTAAIVTWYFANTLPDLKGMGALVVALPAGGLAWYIPMVALGFLEKRRLGKLERQLPTTIDAMAGALQAGSSLAQAMELTSREVAAPIGLELGIVVREMAVGVPMQEAFANMLNRARSLDLDMLVTAIIIQHRIGGNLSQILRNISHTIRERLRIKGEIAVLTAQQRLSGYIVSGLPLFIIGALFIIAPTYISKLFLPGIARFMLIAGAIGMLAGFYALKKIADIDV
ncbi:MAG: type II secretion system F family protein [Chloroflexota bacterium]